MCFYSLYTAHKCSVERMNENVILTKTVFMLAEALRKATLRIIRDNKK